MTTPIMPRRFSHDEARQEQIRQLITYATMLGLSGRDLIAIGGKMHRSDDQNKARVYREQFRKLLKDKTIKIQDESTILVNLPDKDYCIVSCNHKRWGDYDILVRFFNANNESITKFDKCIKTGFIEHHLPFLGRSRRSDFIRLYDYAKPMIEHYEQNKSTTTTATTTTKVRKPRKSK